MILNDETVAMATAKAGITYGFCVQYLWKFYILFIQKLSKFRVFRSYSRKYMCPRPDRVAISCGNSWRLCLSPFSRLLKIQIVYLKSEIKTLNKILTLVQGWTIRYLREEEVGAISKKILHSNLIKKILFKTLNGRPAKSCQKNYPNPSLSNIYWCVPSPLSNI